LNRFIYKARNAERELLEDEIEALNKKDALHKLAEKGLTPFVIEEKGLIPNASEFFLQFSRISLRDLVIFFRQLSSISSAGVPLHEALQVIEGQITSPAFKKIVLSLARDIEGGKSFSQSLARHPLVFSKLIVAMIEVGEKSGTLGTVLAKISSHLEKENQFQHKIKSAMRYPIMVFTSLGLAFLFSIVFIIPRFSAVFSAFKTKLPLPTRILLGLNYVITSYYWVVILFAIVLFLVFRWYRSTKSGRHQIDQFVLNFPVLGGVITKVALSRFFRMLSAMISSGVPLVYGLEVASRTADNQIITDAILGTRARVISGGSLSSGMRDYAIFPSITGHMIAIGEKAGNLEEMLAKSADYFDEETDYVVSGLMELMEPILILSMGALVLMLALGIFLPMWSLMSLYK
jgi:type II secretory pathway component PulF